MNATARASAMPQRSAGGHYSRPRYSAIGGNSTFRRIMLPAMGLPPRDPEAATALIPQGNQRRAVHSVVARATGLEPATSGVTGRRSNQLSYARPRQGAGSMAVTNGCQAGHAGNSTACRSFLPHSAAPPAQPHRNADRQARNRRYRRPSRRRAETVSRRRCGSTDAPMAPWPAHRPGRLVAPAGAGVEGSGGRTMRGVSRARERPAVALRGAPGGRQSAAAACGGR